MNVTDLESVGYLCQKKQLHVLLVCFPVYMASKLVYITALLMPYYKQSVLMRIVGNSSRTNNYLYNSE